LLPSRISASGGFGLLGKFFGRFEEIAGAIILAVMAVITFVNVITRYVIKYPLAFTEEITVSMFVWLVLIGTSIGFRKNAHLAMTFVYDMAPVNVRKVFFFIANGLCVIFFALLAWLGSTQVWDEWSLGVTSDALAIPACIYSAGIPVFSVLIMIRILQSSRDIMRERAF
jgi:TRAP-type C4-dicarboxylate transport system permease small subunit